ncbi:hypothetical protein [Candidatus Cyanaurora vandensis]|uniref:hypothetical protein n=1 Tax=Candidatus Cyanaurora vandensis TaxID=2714958 RepID=UPI00257D660E|nr:hypothetical protein [Candidatus Cyanaurora vandensis]
MQRTNQFRSLKKAVAKTTHDRFSDIEQVLIDSEAAIQRNAQQYGATPIDEPKSYYAGQPDQD